MTPEEAAFQAALDRDPSDHVSRLVFADWLEEHDDPRAAGYRALGLCSHAPYGFVSATLWCFVKKSVLKCYGNETRHRLWQVGSVLPDDWYSLLTRHPDSGSLANEWSFRCDAEDDAAFAFSRLPPERQAELPTSVEVPT